MSNPYTQNDLTRAEELAFKRGFDAGIEHQKKANPPPKAHELKKQLDAALADAARLREDLRVAEALINMLVGERAVAATAVGT